jgi:hypothetical protein
VGRGKEFLKLSNEYFRRKKFSAGYCIVKKLLEFRRPRRMAFNVAHQMSQQNTQLTRSAFDYVVVLEVEQIVWTFFEVKSVEQKESVVVVGPFNYKLLIDEARAEKVKSLNKFLVGKV